MRSIIRVGFILIVGLLVGACASKRISIPGFSSGAGKTQLPPYTVKTLPNGLKIYFVKDESLPRISLSATVLSGSLEDPANKAGVNAMVAYLLSQGTRTKSAIQLADAFGALGTEFSAAPGHDMTSFGASALSTQSGELLALFHEVLTTPSFADAEINKRRSLILSALQKRIDNPSAFAGRQFSRYLNQDQGYGRDPLGNSQSIRQLRKVDLIRHYLNHYRPNNTLVAVAGRFDEAFMAEVERVFGTWEKKEVEPVQVAALEAHQDLRTRWVARKGLAQAQIRFGTPTVPRVHEDYMALRLASEALGGGFGARLMQRIRDDLGLTYSIYAGASADKHQGFLQISTFTKNDSVGKTIEEVLAVYGKFVQEGITAKELEMAKAQMLGQFPRLLETPDQVASQLVAVEAYGLPLTYLTEYEKNVSRVSLTQVNAAIKKHLSPRGLKVLVYGDEGLAPQLAPYSPEKIPAAKLVE